MAIIETYAVWVCKDCMLHHANGECGTCHTEWGHTVEPLSKLSGEDLSMGDTDNVRFTWYSCEGCGDGTADDRYEMWVHVHD